ncbi:hypothetical protein ACFSCW_04040 [Sphingomonas tabacisoli]|uniref:Tail fiber protein n=1 Tax=Sphingomonas tabacisoli TaxID=2249466 RepID=A0ABW4I0M7_9SPHN
MASLGFGIDLALKRRDAGAAVPASAIASLQVLPANGLQAVDGADAADANGWVAKVVLPDDGVSTFDPTRIVLTVSDPGFDASGAATTVVRTIRGTAVLRKQYPNQTQRLNSASGGVRTVHFALDDDVYQGSTLVSGQALAGYYGAAASGAIGGMSNGSTRAYPKPLFAWVNMHHERATGGSYAVEGVAFHRHAMNGRQVACVQYQARDAQAVANLSATVSASVPQLSTIQTKGQIAEVYAASVSLANLAQADLCRVNAKVYPWLGDATAVLDLLTDGVSVSGDATTINPQTPLRFLNDKTGGYGGACAIVKPGGTATGSGKVAAGYGGLGATAADAYPTIAAALTALQSYNQANKGHTDPAGGTIYLSEDAAGAGATHGVGNTSASAAGKCWVEIVKDPGATGTVKAQLAGANVAQASMLRWGCPFEINAGNFNGGSGNTGNTWVAFRGNAINAVASTSAPFNYGFAHSYFENVTMTGGANMPLPFFGFGGTARIQVRCVGLLFEDMPAVLANRYAIQPFTLIGCRFANGFFDDGNWSVNWDSCDGGVICNTQFLKTQAACVLASGALPGGYARGFALVQNVIERTNTASSPALQLGADGTTQAFTNFVEFHNTLPGAGGAGANIGRTNRAYADVAGAAGVLKRITSRFNVWYDCNIKTDTFTTNTTASGRTGNWRSRYHVGDRGNVSVLGDDQGFAVSASGTTWLGEVWPGDGKASAASIGFVNNAAGTSGAGDYRVTGGSNDAYGRVAGSSSSGVTIGGAAVPLAALRFDIAGVARKTDGNGAAGAYERTDI